MGKSSLVTKKQVAPFINVAKHGSGEDWKQIKKSSAFAISMNPQVKTYDFISEDNPIEEITGYQPSLSQSITMFKGEDDYQCFFDMIFERPTADSAHRDLLLVFFQEKGENTQGGGTVFKAWKVDSLVKLNQMDTVNESIDIDFSLNKIEKGAVSTESGTPVFMKGEWSGESFTEK